MEKIYQPGSGRLQAVYFNFDCFRLASYNLSDAHDDLANYLILSLQNDLIVPKIAVIYYFLREGSMWIKSLIMTTPRINREGTSENKKFTHFFLKY